MNRGVAGHTLQGHGGIHQLFHLVGAFIQGFQIGEAQSLLDGNAQLLGHGAGHHVHVGVAHAHGAARIPNGGAGGQGAEGDDLGHVIPSVLIGHVGYDLVAAVVAEVHVDIGHGHALGVEEPLKEQVKGYGIHLGDADAVGNERTRAGSTAGAYGDILGLGEVDVILHDEEVVVIAHAPDHAQLVGDAVAVGLLGVLAVIKDDLTIPHTAGKPLLGKAGEVLPRGQPVGTGEFGQVGLGEIEFQIAPLSNADGVLNGSGVAGEEHLHLPRVLVVELVGGKAHLAVLAHGAPRLDTGQHLLHVGILAAEVVAIVGSHQREVALPRQPHESGEDLPLLGEVVVLDLDVVVPRSEDRGHGESGVLGTLVVPRQEPLGDVTRQTGRQGDQTLVVAAQQLHIHAGTAVKALGKARRDQSHEVLVALHVLAEEDEVVIRPLAALHTRLIEAGIGGDVDLTADDGLDARLFAGLVKGDCAVQHAVIRNGHGIVTALLHPRGEVGYTARAVQKAVFGVEVKMDEGAHGRSPFERFKFEFVGKLAPRSESRVSISAFSFTRLRAGAPSRREP